ncbi:hypothetical protein C8Q79DRAFT_232554 [Trametes meyenii]|nr:hypothetical protein C8Q79DRAFT_232554 [Trametes meyenii]
MGKTSSHFETNASPNFEREHVLPTCTCPTQSTSALPTQNVAREAPPLDISYPQPDATLRADATWASMSSRPIHVIPVAPSTTVWRQNRAMASPALEWDTALAPLDAGFRDFSTVSNRATDYFASLRSAGHFPVPETSISQDFVRPPLGNVARPSDLDPPPSYTLEPLTSLGFLGANEFDAVIPVGHPMMDRLRGTVRDPEIHAKFEKMSSQLRNQVVLEPGLTHGTQAPSASDLVALVTTSPQDVAPEVGAQVGFKDEVASREEFSFDSDEARCWFRFEELR